MAIVKFSNRSIQNFFNFKKGTDQTKEQPFKKHLSEKKQSILQHECQTRVLHKPDTSEAPETEVRHE